MKISSNSTLTVWVIAYGSLLFSIACCILFVLKKYPSYKFFLIGNVVACFLVILHIMIRQYSYAKYISKMKKKQDDNIVPGQCPDYWSKKASSTGVMCVNEFVTTNPDKSVNKVTLGTDATPKTIDIKTFSGLSNQNKCQKSSSMKTPWVDMDIKCEAAQK